MRVLKFIIFLQILLINLILVGGESDASDMNDDGITNILDVIQLINIILLP